MKNDESELKLNKETIEAIEKTRKKMKNGRFLTEEEVRKKLNL